MERQLAILDIDETLIYSADRLLDREPDFCLGGYFVYKRPFLSEFLAAVFDWFQVGVWSSASGPYVHGIVHRVFPDPAQLRFVWARDRCTRRFDPEHRQFYWVKNLRKVKRMGFSLTRVLMIDDSPEKVKMHYGNHLRLRPFVGEAEDEELRLVLPFLDTLRHAANLREVEKRYWRIPTPFSEVARSEDASGSSVD